VKLSRRVLDAPPYLFAQIDKAREAALARGVDVVSLGIGDPDKPTAPFVIDAARLEVANPANHRYPPYQGATFFLDEAAAYFAKRFGIPLAPLDNVLALVGSKEGIAHLALAVIDPGSVALVPDPGYPVYATSTKYAGGESYAMPLAHERGFIPDLGAIPSDVADRARIIWVNYPNNPTGAVAPLDFYKDLVAFARKHDLVIASDAAYMELYADEGDPPHSVLEVEGALERTIEFHSFSKMFNMTGWRIGFAVGGKDIVAALGNIKTNVDSGTFVAVQNSAARGLVHPDFHAFLRASRDLIRSRVDFIKSVLDEVGVEHFAPQGTFYVWCKVPRAFGGSVEFCSAVLDKVGLVVTPGVGYGAHGEGYFRISVTTPESELERAAQKLKVFFR